MMIRAMTRRDEDGRPLHESWKPIRLLLHHNVDIKLTIDEARRLHEVLGIAISHHDNDEDYNDD